MLLLASTASSTINSQSYTQLNGFIIPETRRKENEIGFVTVATTRRTLTSDTGAFADWVSSADKINAINNNDLSLGFNAGPSSAAAGSSSHHGTHHHHHPMWPGSAAASAASSSRYGLPPEVGMFVVAPATSFHHPHQDPSMISPDPNHPINVGVIPLLTASMDDSVDLIGNRSRGGAIQFWQQSNNQPHHHHHQQQQQQAGYFNKPAGSINFDHNNAVNLMSTDGGAAVGGSGGSTATCQDCGNQAKKDCSHRRCRTCCRSRGFDCTTHVRSTWVPAARRRERQMMGVAGSGGASSGSTSGAKKPRLIASQNTTATTSHTSNSNTPPRSYETSSSHQEAGFKETLPRQVRAPAVFKCVRVTAVEDGEDEYAYQAVVRIGGHVFKGFLYDQGAESGDGFPNLSELHLGGSGGGGGGGGVVGGGGRNGASSSSPILDPPEVYGASSGGFLGGGGSSYGNTIN